MKRNDLYFFCIIYIFKKRMIIGYRKLNEWLNLLLLDLLKINNIMGQALRKAIIRLDFFSAPATLRAQE